MQRGLSHKTDRYRLISDMLASFLGGRAMKVVRLWVTGFLAAGVLLAQTSTGEIDVTVHDPSGAVIPRATVIITGAQTANRVRALVSNDAGLAAAPLLQPGEYDIAVTSSGFEKLLRNGVVL